ncbi:YitT family protein [Paenibacillus filicis]|uniref:YitT family protein n=1 Tax=Paenibacillus filicis TaxID=669464 RepID=A0ABU9DNM8_9BACL
MNHRPGSKLQWLPVGAILIGVLLVSIGLEMFLTPHKIIPGGVKGIAILLSHVTEMKMGLFLLFINLPFVLFNKRKPVQMLSALISLIVITALAIFMHPFPPLLENPLPAALCGGLTLGVGLGLIIRYGWYPDGLNIVAVYLNRRLRLSIGELVMILNLLILACGGFLFGWDQAIHSVIAYFAAFKAIQFTLEFRNKKLIWISCEGPRERLVEQLRAAFGSEIEFLKQHQVSGDTPSDPQLFLVVPSRHIQRLKSLVRELCPTAQVVVSYATPDAPGAMPEGRK